MSLHRNDSKRSSGYLCVCKASNVVLSRSTMFSSTASLSGARWAADMNPKRDNLAGSLQWMNCDGCSVTVLVNEQGGILSLLIRFATTED